MIIKRGSYLEDEMLLDLNTSIHHESKLYEYHMAHIKLAKEYAILLNKRLGSMFSNRKLSFIALSHDCLKERSLDPSKTGVMWMGHEIPQDLNKYVRTHLEVLAEFGMDDFFNTDVQLHALSAAIFLRMELGIRDPEIIYPVMFHSCPIISVYETLTPTVRSMVDIMMLADKLSSNYLRINMRGSPVRIDLDLAVFGQTGREFNYTLGLYLARLIGQGKSTETQSSITTEYYYKRVAAVNPMISKRATIKRMGVSEIWPKRKSPAWIR